MMNLLPGRAVLCASLLFSCIVPVRAGAQPAAAAPVMSDEYLARAVRVPAPPRLDGRLDDPVWTQGPILSGFTQREPQEGVPATEPTEVRILYTADTLYFGIRCRDSEPEALRGYQLRWDGDQSGDDRVELILDTFADRRNAYAFRFTVLGAQWDAQVRDQGRIIREAWDGVWYVRTARGEDGWSAEVAIPFSTLRFPETDVQSWGFNVQRVIRRKNEDTFWAPVPRGVGAGQGVDGKYQLTYAGQLTGLEGIRPGSRWELRPYGLGGASGSDPGHLYGTRDAGMDARFTLSNSLTADLTFNTDFAQVEADQEQINLDRFPLFYPEKREFFLEGLDVFSFGMGEYNAAPPFQLFYSRRIGLADASDGSRFEVPLRTGFKLTGRSGPWTIGALETNTGARTWRGGTLPVAIPQSSQGVLRVSRDILSRSRVGVIGAATDHGLDGRAYSAGGADLQLALLRNTQVDAFAAWSRRGDGAWAPAGALNYSWGSDLWAVEATNLYVDPDWGDDLGFVARPGVMRNKLGLTWSPRPDLPGVRQTLFFLDTSYFTRPSGHLESRMYNPGVVVLLENGGQVIAGWAHRYEGVDGGFSLGAFDVSPGAYRFDSLFLYASTDPSAPFGTTSQVSGGTYYGGHRLTLLPSLWWRPSPRWQSQIQLVTNDIRGDGTRFRGSVAALRLTWTPTTTWVVKLFTQLNTASDTGSSNLLLGWRYRPRSYLYLVYNTLLEAPDGSWNTGEQVLLLKLTYLSSP